MANPLCEQIDDPALQGLLLASALEARNTSTLLAFVRAGLGATVLPRSVLSGDDGGLVFLHPVDPPARRELRKIRTTARMPTPLAEAFWQVLRLP
ncbi:MAG: LysR substrate-binding domain-containing protein [Paracoccaceae bacterium]